MVSLRALHERLMGDSLNSLGDIRIEPLSPLEASRADLGSLIPYVQELTRRVTPLGQRSQTATSQITALGTLTRDLQSLN